MNKETFVSQYVAYKMAKLIKNLESDILRHSRPYVMETMSLFKEDAEMLYDNWFKFKGQH